MSPSSVTGGFPTQRAGNAESIPIAWRQNLPGIMSNPGSVPWDHGPGSSYPNRRHSLNWCPSRPPSTILNTHNTISLQRKKDNSKYSNCFGQKRCLPPTSNLMEQTRTRHHVTFQMPVPSIHSTGNGHHNACKWPDTHRCINRHCADYTQSRLQLFSP